MFSKDSLGRLRKNGKVFTTNPRKHVMRLTDQEKELILDFRKNEI